MNGLAFTFTVSEVLSGGGHGYASGQDGITYNGVLITYNGSIIKDMDDLIEILNERTITLTVPANTDTSFNGAMLTPAITEVTKRGITVIDDATDFQYDDWELDGGADPTAGTIFASDTEKIVNITFNV